MSRQPPRATDRCEDDVLTKAKRLMEFANGGARGYLKQWKAVSMISSLEQIEPLQTDKERRDKWVMNCLLMEGFREDDCLRISEFLPTLSDRSKSYNC